MVLETHPISTTFFNKQDSTTLTWLGMAGIMINAHGSIILIDPLISYIEKDGQRVSEEGYPLKLPYPIEANQIPHADLVCYTHADDDHLGRLTAQTLADQTNCKYLAPPPVVNILKEIGIESGRILIAKDYDELDLGETKITITPALHDWQKENPWQRGDCCGYITQTPEGSIWHPGDTRLIDELYDFKDVDILMFDVAAVDAHLGPQGSAELAKRCNPQVMLPYHYGTFDLPPGSFGGCLLEDALPYVRDVQSTLLPINPGQVIPLPININ